MRCRVGKGSKRAPLPLVRCLQYRYRIWVRGDTPEGMRAPLHWWQWRHRAWQRFEDKPMDLELHRSLTWTKGAPPIGGWPADVHGRARCPICFRRLRRKMGYDVIACPSRYCTYAMDGMTQHYIKHYSLGR